MDIHPDTCTYSVSVQYICTTSVSSLLAGSGFSFLLYNTTVLFIFLDLGMYHTYVCVYVVRVCGVCVCVSVTLFFSFL